MEYARLRDLEHNVQNRLPEDSRRSKDILAMKASPLSWIKPGDLGQNKQADGAKYDTFTATRSYTAPRLRETTNTESLDYTNVLDIWAVGCISYRPRTDRSLFLSAPFRNAIEQRFVDGSYDFSKNSLELSEAGTQPFRLLLAVDLEKRPTALGALRDEWQLSDEAQKTLDQMFNHPISNPPSPKPRLKLTRPPPRNAHLQQSPDTTMELRRSSTTKQSRSR
ncbi:hypothetical protein BGZ57DRAFT_1001678 [Hyaloscypha finlandica]|nr:hypothetical protein BGZ57DRAFT_1001678 [Hyaloscypha finlandica]